MVYRFEIEALDRFGDYRLEELPFPLFQIKYFTSMNFAKGFGCCWTLSSVLRIFFGEKLSTVFQWLSF
jgi:hypothetical protein